MIQQHFVVFQSPGTFVAEEDTHAIGGWDVEIATHMARDICQRHGAKPYGFRFITREDSKIIAKSNFYWLGGVIETLAEVEARNDPKEEILRENMRHNNIDHIVINNNSYKWTAPFKEGDVLLEFTP